MSAVDVLAVMDADIERQRIGVAAGRCDADAMAEFEAARAAVAELIELACMVDRSDNAARWGDACRPIVTKARECLALVGGAS